MPEHVAIIMDGNGRWASRMAQHRLFGHRAGAKVSKDIIYACGELGIKVLTLFAFSTENWNRPAAEVDGLMKLLDEYLKSEVDDLDKNQVRLELIGDIARLPQFVRTTLDTVQNRLKNNTGLVLCLALSYGARDEIFQAAEKLALEYHANPQKYTLKDLEKHLFTRAFPDPDLIIRTSGEMRLSNFMLWQSAYSEFYFTPKFWPDFKVRDFIIALLDFQSRERRFGRV